MAAVAFVLIGPRWMTFKERSRAFRTGEPPSRLSSPTASRRTATSADGNVPMATPGALNAFAATGENPINYIVRHMNLDPGSLGAEASWRTCGPSARARACSRPTNCGTALAS
jgi:hypothetical protein